MQTLEPTTTELPIPMNGFGPLDAFQSKKQAQQALISAMNGIKQQKNVAQFQIHQLLRGRYLEGHGNLPPNPVYRATFTKRNIQRAVFMARQIGGYDSLLEAAGYRAHK